MARKEAITCDTVFYNNSNRRATHVGISPDITETLKRLYVEPVRGDFNTVTYVTPQGEKMNIVFTDVLVMLVPGPAYKLPKRSIK